MRYVATINTPGHSPMDDDPPVFDTAREAWEYLAENRRTEEDFFYADSEAPYSATVDALDAFASNTFRLTGTVYGGTPGYTGTRDLGLAYTVDIAEE